MVKPAQKEVVQGIAKSQKKRVVFIDQARALAITMMLVGHSLDRYLGEPWRSGEAYGDYQFIRGITSALFLMVSGFSFVVASFKYWGEYTRPSPRLWARLRRIGFIVFLGYALHLYGSTLIQVIYRYTPERLEGFLRFDVLQNIGVGLLLLHGITFLVRKREHFWKGALGVAVVLFALAPLTYSAMVNDLLPVGISSALNMFHRSLFPIVPFTGYLLVGAVFGYWFYKGQEEGTSWRSMAALAVFGILLLGLEYVIGHWIGDVFPYSTPRANMPGNTFARLGCAMLVISGLWLLARYVVFLPRLSFLLSKESLAIYFVHLVIVYSGNLNLFKDYIRMMTPPQVVTYIMGLILLMGAMALVLHHVRSRYPFTLTAAHRWALVTFGISFTIWPVLSPFRVAISGIIALYFILGHYKLIRFPSRIKPDIRVKS